MSKLTLDNVTVVECKDGIKTRGNVEVDMKDTTFEKVHGQLFDSSDNPEIPEREESAKTKKNWYQKPIGIIAISITGIFLATCLVWAVNHYTGLNL